MAALLFVLILVLVIYAARSEYVKYLLREEARRVREVSQLILAMDGPPSSREIQALQTKLRERGY